MTVSTHPFFPTGQDPRTAVRQWLMEGMNPNAQADGGPLWAYVMGLGHWSAVDELLAAGADVQARDDKGQGWLHWAVSSQAPTWLALAGLRQLGSNWWWADHVGITPFHLDVQDARLAEAMVVRWWSEGRPWSLLAQPHDPVTTQSPAGKTWRAWQPLLRP